MNRIEFTALRHASRARRREQSAMPILASAWHRQPMERKIQDAQEAALPPAIQSALHPRGLVYASSATLRGRLNNYHTRKHSARAMQAALTALAAANVARAESTKGESS